MKKFINPFKIPREPKDIFVWLIKQAFIHLGCGGTFGFVALLIVSLSIFGFLVGDYTSGGQGTPTDASVNLDTATTQENSILLNHYNDVANSWEKGLTQSQILQVQQEQVDLPGAVLLSVGKMINNMNPTNAHKYYSFLEPKYTWKTFINIKIVYKTVYTKSGPVCTQTETDTPVTMLMTADTWDGTLTNGYIWVEQGKRSCNSTWTKTIALDTSKQKRTYDWSKIWNLFAKVPAGQPGHTYIINKTQSNKDILAGLIAAIDYSIADPEIQRMVSIIMFPGGGTGIGNLGPVKPADGNTIHDVVRWKSYIVAIAAKYKIPPILVAGIMAQESGGNEFTQGGALLTSSAGAVGLMQVEPSTAFGLYLNGSLIGGKAMAYLSNPEMNIEIGAVYISELYHDFNGIFPEIESGYNAGEGGEDDALAHGHQIAQNSQTIQYVNLIQNTWIPALEKDFGTPPAGSGGNYVNTGSPDSQLSGGIGR